MNDPQNQNPADNGVGSSDLFASFLNSPAYREWEQVIKCIPLWKRILLCVWREDKWWAARGINKAALSAWQHDDMETFYRERYLASALWAQIFDVPLPALPNTELTDANRTEK